MQGPSLFIDSFRSEGTVLVRINGQPLSSQKGNVPVSVFAPRTIDPKSITLTITLLRTPELNDNIIKKYILIRYLIMLVLFYCIIISVYL